MPSPQITKEAASAATEAAELAATRQWELEVLKILRAQNEGRAIVIEGENITFRTMVKRIRKALADAELNVPLNDTAIDTERMALLLEDAPELGEIALRREAVDIGREARRGLVGESAQSMRVPLGGKKPGHVVIHVPEPGGTLLVELYDPTFNPIVGHNEKSIADALGLERLFDRVRTQTPYKLQVRAYDYHPTGPVLVYDSLNPRVLEDVLERSRLQTGVTPWHNR